MGSPAAVGTRSAHTPCLTAAPRKLPVQPSRRGEACCFLAQRLQLSKQYLPVCRARQQQHTELVAAKHKFWLSLGVISPLTVSPTAARADELTAAAGNAAQAASQAAPDLPPTVTFGGSFGQYDPIIAVFFYAVIAALTVLTLGVSKSGGTAAIAVVCMHASMSERVSCFGQLMLTARALADAGWLFVNPELAR